MILLNEDYARICLEEAEKLGASYCDVRFSETDEEQISTKNERPDRIELLCVADFGVRVIVNGAWGFSGSRNMDSNEMTEATREAVNMAKGSALTKKNDVRLCECRHFQTKYGTPVHIDPFKVPQEEILDILLSSERIIRAQSNHIKTTYSLFRAFKQKKFFASSEGSSIHQTIVWCGGGIYAIASRSGEVQRRSYPAFYGSYNTGGFEAFNALQLIENSERVGREAVALLNAKPCPSDVRVLLLGPEQLWMQIHESCGHATELDRVLGSEIDLAGTSFLAPELLNTYSYGSEEVNLTVDSTVRGGLGSYGFDEEGVAAKKVYLVKEGQFVGFQTSRETASVIGLDESSGSMRSDYSMNQPIIRMSNINLLPGDWKRDEIIEDTREGILMDTIRSWSIDERRLNFQFGSEIGYTILDGELNEMVKNPTYAGNSPEFWRGCDATSKDDWRLLGTPDCGKGRPEQYLFVGHGCGTTRFNNVRVGII